MMPAPPNSSQQGTLKQRTGEGGSSSSTTSQSSSSQQTSGQGSEQKTTQSPTTKIQDRAPVNSPKAPAVIGEIRGKLGTKVTNNPQTRTSTVTKQPDQKFQDRVPQGPKPINAMQGGLGMQPFGKSTMSTPNVVRNASIPQLTGGGPTPMKDQSRVPSTGMPELPPELPPRVANDTFLQNAESEQIRRQQMESMMTPPGGIAPATGGSVIADYNAKSNPQKLAELNGAGLRDDFMKAYQNLRQPPTTSPMAGQGSPAFSDWGKQAEFNEFALVNYGNPGMAPDPNIASGPETQPDPPDSWWDSAKKLAGDGLQAAKAKGQEIYDMPGDADQTVGAIKGYLKGGPLGAIFGGLGLGSGGKLPAWQLSGDERGDRNPFVIRPPMGGGGYDNGLAYMNQLLRKYFNG